MLLFCILYNQIPIKYRFGKHYQFFVDLLNDSKKMSSHELNSFQLKQLTKQIEICKNSVPFYKDILIDVELPITSIEHFKDQIPFTTKDQIRRNHKYFRSEEHTSELQS